MATITTHHDESLVESNEILYTNANMIDSEPLYKNFTTIQAFRQQNNEEKQSNTPICEKDFTYRANYVQCEISSLQSSSSDEQFDINQENSSKINDESISGLTKTIEDSDYNPDKPYKSSILLETKNTRSNEVAKLGENQRLIINTLHSYAHKQYVPRWYQAKYQSYASSIQSKTVSNVDEDATEKIDDSQSDISTDSVDSNNVMIEDIDEDSLQDQIKHIYGIDDGDASSSVSNLSSTIHEIKPNSDQYISTSVLKPIDNLTIKPKLTIREYYPSKEIPSIMCHRSSLSAQSSNTTSDNQYELLIENDLELNQDPNPEIVIKKNPEQVVYKRNVSIRYLVPPTPPPPGPLIIREIIPPHPPTQPPLVVESRHPEPRTPTPQIIREIPPPPPAYQDAQIITKVRYQEPCLPEPSFIENTLPPKPQSIIIEKWLPYKPPPPREVIYERVIEPQMVSHFQPNRPNFYSSSYLPDPIYADGCVQSEQIESRMPSEFEQFAWLTQQQLEEIERVTLERIMMHQQQLANQQQSTNRCMQASPPLVTPILVVNHSPVTRTITTCAQLPDTPQATFYQPIFTYSSYS